MRRRGLRTKHGSGWLGAISQPLRAAATRYSVRHSLGCPPLMFGAQLYSYQLVAVIATMTLSMVALTTTNAIRTPLV